MADNNENAGADAYASAWRDRQAEIDGFLVSEGTRVAHLISPHGTGKSTGLLLHAFHQAVKMDMSLLYLLPTNEEAFDLCELLTFRAPVPEADAVWLATDDERPPPAAIILGEYDDLSHLQHLDRAMLIMADMELRYTVEGELFFSRLLALVRKNEHPHAVLLLSTCRSPHTVEAFRREGCSVTELEVRPTAPAPHIDCTVVDGDQWEDQVQAAIESAKSVQPGPGDRRSLVVARMTQNRPSPAAFQVIDFDRTDELPMSGGGRLDLCDALWGHDLAHDTLVFVDPEVDVVVACRGLRLFLSDGMVRCRVMDLPSGQVVTRLRPLLPCEKRREETWVRRSAFRSPDVRFLRRAVPDSHPGDEGAMHPAWNGDVYLLILRMMLMWPDRAPAAWPMRRMPNRALFREIWTRLEECGCIRQDRERPGIATVTERGMVALDSWCELDGSMPHQPDFHCLCLMATVPEDHDQQVRGVLRLLGMMIHGEVEFRGGEPDYAEIDAALGRPGLASRGWVWSLLGVLAQLDADGHLQLEGEYEDDGEGAVRVVCGMQIDIFRARRFAMEYASNYGDGQNVRQLARLSIDQIVAVEFHLLVAYQHRCLYFRPGNMPQDVCSRTRVHIDGFITGETIDVDKLHEVYDNGFFAVYNELHHIDGQYFAQGVTAVHPITFSRFSAADASIPVATMIRNATLRPQSMGAAPQPHASAESGTRRQ